MLRIGSFLTGLIAVFLTAHVARAQETVASIYFESGPSVTAATAGTSSACDLTPTARDLLAEIVKRWREAGEPQFIILGHDDQAEDKDVSLAISACRANRVFRAAQELGLDPARAFLYALGESRPAYEAGDGQREPLNRRVEIEFYK